jgi:hypothetical protein
MHQLFHDKRRLRVFYIVTFQVICPEKAKYAAMVTGYKWRGGEMGIPRWVRRYYLRKSVLRSLIQAKFYNWR